MADVEDDFPAAPIPEYPTGSGERTEQGDSSTHQFHSTISRDASNGHEKHPIFSEAQLHKDSDDEEQEPTSRPPIRLDQGTNKWNEHAKFATEYIKKSKSKEGRPLMPQSLNDRPDMSTARATARANGLDRVRSSYDMPTPESNRSSRRVVELEPGRQRYSPPSVVEEVDDEDSDEGIYHRRPRSPSPIRVPRSSLPPPPVPTDSGYRRRVVEPERIIERTLPVRRPPVVSHRHHHHEYSERRPHVPRNHDLDLEESPRYQAPPPLPRASTFARSYDYIEEDEPIAAPRKSTAKRNSADHGRNEDDYPSYAYPPESPSIGPDIRYTGSEIWRSQEADQAESVDDLESTWTPETMPPSRYRPPMRKPASKAPSYRILCRIECDVVHERRLNEDRVHPALIFEDVPHWNPRFTKTKGHLTGFRPIYSLSQWLKSINPLSFVVYRTYSCSWGSFKANPRDGAINMPTVRVSDSEAQDFNESIEVLSSELEEALLSVAKCKMECFTGLQDADSRNDNLIFDSPYLFFYHHRAVLSELSKQGDERLRREIFPLLIYLKERQRALYKQADYHFAKKTTDANVLKFLFCPNEIVVSKKKKNGIECAYAIRYLHFYPDESVELVCWAWTYDGTELKRRSEKIHVTYKAGDARSVLELAAYPLRFAPEELRAKLLARGTRFWELRTPQLVTYKGMNFLQEKYINDGRCMLDYPTYKIMHREAEPFNLKKDLAPRPLDYDNFPETISKDAALSEEETILCPPNIHGFLLKEKVWVNLFVDNVHGVTWNKDAFKRLVMPPNTKDLVEALIKAHASASWQQGGLVTGKRLDLIAGKGLGLIMLLHGSPGTGKTLTAESVAEIAEMPLYSVTCGDIGIEVDKVEQYLEKVLYLGKKWNCVLLLDEADVFLEERSLNDLKRNSLVSVFLRTLEYYEGILILTSNRVGTFDEAFRSRIQLALHYPKLTPPFRRRIWQNFFDILSEDKEDVDLPDLTSHMDELSKREMNGREIRNALTSARQLASYKGVTLEWRHLLETMSVGEVFGKYLRDVHGHADEDWAREEQLR